MEEFNRLPYPWDNYEIRADGVIRTRMREVRYSQRNTRTLKRKIMKPKPDGRVRLTKSGAASESTKSPQQWLDIYYEQP